MDDYIFEPGLPASRATNYLNPRGWEFLVYRWLGWVLSPSGTWVRDPELPEETSPSSLMQDLNAAWTDTMRRNGGSESRPAHTTRAPPHHGG